MLPLYKGIGVGQVLCMDHVLHRGVRQREGLKGKVILKKEMWLNQHQMMKDKE